MGWMKPWQQQQVLTLYGIQATYRCDYCQQPILVNQLHVEDPKGGYYPRTREDINGFRGPRAKKTYHLHPCDEIRRGKRLAYQEDPPAAVAPKTEKEKKTQEPVKAGKLEKKIIETIQGQPKKKWTVWDIILALREKYPQPKIRTAVRNLKADGTIKKKDGCLKVKKGA